MITQQELKELIAHCDVWQAPNFAPCEDSAGNQCLGIKLALLRGGEVPTFDFTTGISGKAFRDLFSVFGVCWSLIPKEKVKERLMALLE